jgi:hypothetical protein
MSMSTKAKKSLGVVVRNTLGLMLPVHFLRVAIRFLQFQLPSHFAIDHSVEVCTKFIEA